MRAFQNFQPYYSNVRDGLPDVVVKYTVSFAKGGNYGNNKCNAGCKGSRRSTC